MNINIQLIVIFIVTQCTQVIASCINTAYSAHSSDHFTPQRQAKQVCAPSMGPL